MYESFRNYIDRVHSDIIVISYTCELQNYFLVKVFIHVIRDQAQQREA